MLLEITILLLGFPVGFLIAWLANDELHVGRKWFFGLMVLSFIGIILFFALRVSYVSLTFGFILIISGVSWLKSGNGKDIIKSSNK